jgi:ribonuclease P protein component
MRVPFKKQVHGSQKWLQIAVNDWSDNFNRAVRSACGFDETEPIIWLSPVRDDEYAEYRDDSWLRRLAIELPQRSLKNFWPPRGPQWDGLGRTRSGKVILLEAKANIPEIVSSACQASDETKSLIQKSFQEVKEFLHVDFSIDWSGKLYQYANRIAHLYFLRALNKIPAYLVFVYFVGDRQVSGPDSVEEWEAALTVAKGVLGIGKRNRLSRYVRDIFINIAEFSL